MSIIDWSKKELPVRTFSLLRMSDETGVSGTGVVARGCIFWDGTAVMRWDTGATSTAVYDSVADLEKIHGHGGKTVVVWHRDQSWQHGVACWALDTCENAPFSSLGAKVQGQLPDRYTDEVGAGESFPQFMAGYLDADREHQLAWDGRAKDAKCPTS